MNSNDLLALEQKYLMQTYKRQPVIFERGEGCYLFDTDGKRYLDLVAGVAVMSLGHSHPAWVRTVREQAGTLVHVSNIYMNAKMLELAERLCRLSGMDRVFFCNSGAEANEGAIKIARKWGKMKRGAGCYKIVTLERAFHGRTLGALSATANRNYCEPFEPLVPGFIQVPLQDLDRLDSLLDGTVCAVMIEAVQGEGGVWPIAPKSLEYLRNLCDGREVLLICDEVQTGIGRTGKWFAFQHAAITPDLMPLAKGLGGGFPIGACLARGEAAAALGPGDHGSTFAGSPLAAAAALAVLDTIEQENLLEHVQHIGGLFRIALENLCVGSSIFDQVRGQGLLLGIEIKKPVARAMVSEALQEGLLINATGDTTLRVVPPLILSSEQVRDATGILGAVAARV